MKLDPWVRVSSHFRFLIEAYMHTFHIAYSSFPYVDLYIWTASEFSVLRIEYVLTHHTQRITPLYLRRIHLQAYLRCSGTTICCPVDRRLQGEMHIPTQYLRDAIVAVLLLKRAYTVS